MSDADPTVKAALLDALEWPLSSLPFETHKNDWALWINPDAKRWLYIEHGLIHQVHQAVESKDYRDTFMGIGYKFLKWLRENGDPEPKMVRVCQLIGCPVSIRFGKFDGRIFIFRPRPQFEDHERQ